MKLKYIFYAQLVIRELLANGVSKEELFTLDGITIDTSNPSESEISFEFIDLLTHLYKERLKTQHCGLELINKLDFRNADIFGPYAYSCSTLGEAIRKIYAVQTSLNPLITYEMKPANKPAQFTYYPDKKLEAEFPESIREIVEFSMASGLLSAESLTQRNITPIELQLKYAAPESVSIYKNIFKCPVYFGKDENCIAYSPEIMDYKIPTYNPALLMVLQEFAEKIIEQNSKNQNIVSEVRTILLKAGNNSIPKEEEIAKILHISKRTLQKKLQDKGTSFLKILDEYQRELAVSYLNSQSVSNKEIAWVLGYNDISNFYRAFKRWTGMTPNEFRAGKNS